MSAGERRTELLSDFALASDALFEAGITRSDSFTGDIGEFVAAQSLGLTLEGRNFAGIDATRDSVTYQIKSVSSAQRTAAISFGPPPVNADKLVGVRLSLAYEPVEVIEIDVRDLPIGASRMTDTMLTTTRCRRISTFPAAVERARPLLRTFADAYLALQDHGLIASRRVVGDLGEQYAAGHLNLTLSHGGSTAGYDATDDVGHTYEIKTRRVYRSARRVSETRRINNLVGKSAEFLVVVELDHSFRCAAMWVMPLGNVINPKSANMRSILNTPGIRPVAMPSNSGSRPH